MKGISSWSYAPYAPINAPQIEKDFYITQLLPFDGGFTVHFRDKCCCEHTLFYRKRGEKAWTEAKDFTVTGLETPCDYECRVSRADGIFCRARLVRTGGIPGAIVNYLHPDDESYAFSGRYLCSPAILRLPSGRLLASMDVYGPQMAQNLTLIFSSDDNGESWQYLSELYPCFWGKMFLHRGDVYMLGMSCEYGDILIGKSADGGKSFTPPVRLFSGANAREMGFHKAPMPVISHGGRLYTAVEYGSWKYSRHDDCILSIDENDDLLKPENWRLTAPAAFDPAWSGLPAGALRGCIEGNAVVAPDGGIVDVLRLEQRLSERKSGDAVILRMTGRDEALVFDSDIRFPLGASSKFVILRDGGWYIAVGNEAFDDSRPRARNVLSLAVSKDLKNWRVAERIVDAHDSNEMLCAFQYPDFCIAGDDLFILSRTAFNGAHSFHDSNAITFHTVRNFRRHLQE